MFKLSTQTSYKWAVKVQIPGNNAFQESSFTAEFKIIPQSRIDSITKKDDEAADLLDEILLGWDGVMDENNQPILFTPETKAALIDIPYIRMAIIRAFFSSIAGRIPKT